MPELEKTYGIPAELREFVDAGFLVVVFEKPERRTVTFGIPSLAYTDENDIETCFTLDWIHPDFNAQFCHYFQEKPGDVVNFEADYLAKVVARLAEPYRDAFFGDIQQEGQS